VTQQATNALLVVFVVDDDIDVREGLTALLESAGLRCEVFASIREFGLDFQAELASANIDIPIIFLTGYRDIPMSLKAMKAGAVASTGSIG